MSKYREDATNEFPLRMAWPEHQASGWVRELLAALPATRVPVFTRVPTTGELSGQIRLKGEYWFYPSPHPSDQVGTGHFNNSIISRCLRAIAAMASSSNSWTAGLDDYEHNTVLGHNEVDSFRATGQPGLVVGPGGLIVRRYGKLWVFPRAQIIRVEELRKRRVETSTGNTVVQTITQLVYDRHGRVQHYLLDATRRPDGTTSPAEADDEALRRLRLEVLQAWMDAPATTGSDR